MTGNQPSLFAVRDQRQPGWFFVDNEIVDRYGSRIGAYGVAVYNVLCRHAKNGTQRVELSARDIGATLNISHDRVGKSFTDLVDVGLIDLEVPERPAPGVVSIITLLNAKVTGRHTSSSEVELDATRPRNKERKTKTKNKPLPPTPLAGGFIWQKVCEDLKSDFATAFVNNQHFQEDSYDKYFRAGWLVKISGGVAILDSSAPEILREGINKYQKRLCDAFRRYVPEIRAVQMNESRSLWAQEASA